MSNPFNIKRTNLFNKDSEIALNKSKKYASMYCNVQYIELIRLLFISYVEEGDLIKKMYELSNI